MRIHFTGGKCVNVLFRYLRSSMLFMPFFGFWSFWFRLLVCIEAPHNSYLIICSTQFWCTVILYLSKKVNISTVNLVCNNIKYLKFGAMLLIHPVDAWMLCYRIMNKCFSRLMCSFHWMLNVLHFVKSCVFVSISHRTAWWANLNNVFYNSVEYICILISSAQFYCGLCVRKPLAIVFIHITEIGWEPLNNLSNLCGYCYTW